MSAQRTIIVGGGLAGVTTAYELARRGEGVLLIEAADEVAKGASFANGGMLTPSMSDPWNSPGAFSALAASLFDPYAAMKLRLHALPGLLGWGWRFLRNSTPARHAAATFSAYTLARRSTELTKEWTEHLSIACDFSPSGALKVFASEAAAEGPISMAKRLGARGLRYEVLSRDQIVEKEPELHTARQNFSCGIYYPDDACGDARAFTLALAKCAQSLGAELRAGVRAERIVCRDGRVAGVATDQGHIDGSRVVLAAGVLSPSLSRLLGVPLAIKPAKGYSLTIDASGWNARPRMPVVDDAMHAAVTPLGSRLRFVGTAEFAGLDDRIDPVRTENLVRLFARLYPHLAENLDRSTAVPWAGLRPMSADGLPYIGAAGPEGVWINAGHGHLGWTMAAGSAELIADLMLGSEPAIDPTPYAAGR